MDIDLRDLELLEALAQHETLTAAANHLFVSQPALSQRLLRLEERLGTALFERQGRRLVPNPAGRRMLQGARVALHELRAAVGDIEAAAGEQSHDTVRLWTQCGTNFQWLPPVLRNYRKSHPRGEVSIANLSDGEYVDALIEGHLDVALITKLCAETGRVRLQRIFDDELVAIVSTRHPWSGRAYVDAPDFAEAHLVLTDSYDPDRVSPTPLPIPPGAKVGRLTLVPAMIDLIIETLLDGNAATVIPSWLAQPYLATGKVTAVQVGAVPQARTWYCATRHGVLPRQVADFAALLVDALEGGPTLSAVA